MSTTIDSLEIKIATDAGRSAININKLANALGRLKDNSKLTTAINNLNRLSETLDNLGTSSGATSGLKKLADGLKSLSGIDLKGFRNAINALARIPKIIDSLDSSTLDKFKRKMKEVAKALEPIADRINAVADGFARFPSKIKNVVKATNQISGSMEDMGSAVNTTGLNLFTTISNLESLVSAINFVADAFSGVIAQAMEWDGIQYRFGRAFGEDAEETYAYIQKINEALGINIQEFMQYSSLYGSLLSGFGMSQQKITAISVGLTELSYDIWAAYNDRFKSLEDASEAVRSAITGEIEPIRNAGIALTEASLQEYLDQVGMASVSIEKLSEAQKSEVRYAAMVNAAMSQGIVGTYAKEMHTAEGAVRGLSQSFKTLVQALGSLFIPMLQIVIPYVTAFVEIITDAIRAVAAFFGIELFKIDWSNTSKGIGSLSEGASDVTTGLDKASKAAKKLRDYTMGFDELNVINPDTGSGASGGSGGGVGADGWGDGLDLDSLWDDSVFDQASKRVSEIKQQILDFMDEWAWAFKGIALALAGLAVYKSWGTILDWGKKIVNVFGLVSSTVRGVWSAFKGSSAAQSALAFISPKLAAVVGAITNFAKYLKLPVWSVFTGILLAIASVVTFLSRNWEEVTNAVKNFFKENFVPKFQEIKKHLDELVDALGPFGKILKEVGGEILSGVGKAFEIVGGIIFSVVGGVIVTALNIFVGAIENTVQIFKGVVRVVSGLFDSIVALFTNGDIGAAWEKIWKGVMDIVKGVGGWIIDPFVDMYNGIVGWFSNLYTELSGKKLPAIISTVRAWFAKLPGIVGTSVKDFVNGVTKRIKDMWANIKTWFDAYVAPKFTKKHWEEKFNPIKNAINTKLNEVKKVITDKWANIKNWFDSYVAPKFTKAHWENKFNSIKSAINTKLTEAKKALVERWASVKEWFNAYVAPKFKKDFWMGKFDGIRSAITTKLYEAKKAALDQWSNIKNWFGTYVSPKFTKDYWMKKFDGIRSAITTKLYEAKKVITDQWSVVRTWFNTNVAPKFTKSYWSNLFDSIRSGIASKLSEAWNKVVEFFSPDKWKKKVDDAIAAIKKNFKIPSLPSISLSVTWDKNVGALKKAVYQALGLDGWPKLKWNAYAQGGFPSMGEMFIAREAGPELVGRIGSKATVANNDQIVTAVSQGVYEAVRAAMGGNSNGGSQNINVYLDGKQIHASVKRTDDSRGANIMGNQLGYLY